MGLGKSGQWDKVELLLKNYDVSVIKLQDEQDDKGRTLLHYAAIDGHLPTVEKLVSMGVTLNVVDAESYTPLNYCQEERHEGVKRYLTERGALCD